MENEVIPPPYVITDDDQRGLVVVITATTLSFVWTCLLIRLWLRVKTREWKSDDYFLAAATALDTVQSGLMFHVVDEGLGRSQESLSQSDLNRIGKDDFGSQILYILTLLLSKCAVLFLYLRLSPARGHMIATWGTIAVSTAWAITSIVLIAVPCHPAVFWRDGPSKCSNIWPRWQAIGTIDAIIEAAIFLISVYLVAQLNMKMRSKIMVVAAFSARLPVIIAIVFRLHYLHSTLNSPDRTLEGAYYVQTTQWHLGYAIMSTTITGLGPFLRPFSKSFSTSYRYGHHPSEPGSSMADPQTRSRNRTEVEEYKMQPLKVREVDEAGSSRKSSTTDLNGQDAASNQNLTLRPDHAIFKRNNVVVGGDKASSTGDEEDAFSRMSDESQQWIIRKKTELTVETDRVSALSERK